MVVKINLIYMITNNSTIKTSQPLSGSVPSSLMLGLITMHSWYLAHNADKSTDNVIKDLKTQLQGSLCLNQNKVQVGTECLEFKASCAEAQDFSVPEVHGTVCYASSDIQESSVLGSIIDVWNLLKNELSSFTSEELCCISNAVGFFIVLIIFTSIITILFGDFLIKTYQIETRFPFLAPLLKLRQKINKFSLIFNIIFVYLVLLLYISLNLFMLYMMISSK